MKDDAGPYGSWGNGSAMRVSPVAYVFDDAERVLAEAERSAAVTHDHPEGIKGAQAVALAVFLARTGSSKEEIRRQVQQRFGYDLDRSIEDIRMRNDSCSVFMSGQHRVIDDEMLYVGPRSRWARLT